MSAYDEWGDDPKIASLHPQTRPDGFALAYYDDIAPMLDCLDFVEGLLVEGSAAVIYGESNSGKTFLMLDIALHVATGMAWMGKEVIQGGVVYVSMEGSSLFRNRVHAWREERGHDGTTHFAAITQPVNMLDSEQDMVALVRAVKEAAKSFDLPVKLIVIDTLSRALAGGNENASEDMGALVRNIDFVRDATKACVIGVHHSGKDATKGARGHSLLRAAVDTEIEVMDSDGNRSATVVKQRDLECGSVYNFSLKPVILGQNRRGKDVTSCVVEPSESQAAGAASDRRRSLKGHTKRAFDVLVDLVAASGAPGHGAPEGVSSVPEKWWRQRFYESAMAGAEPKVKQNQFRRSADLLVEQFIVGMRAGRVWVVNRRFDAHNDTSKGTSE